MGTATATARFRACVRLKCFVPIACCKLASELTALLTCVFTADNDFYDLEIGQCHTAVLVNYSIANRFHNFVIGAVHTGFRLNFTNQLDIYSPTVEVFEVAIDASYGDTTHVYNAYLLQRHSGETPARYRFRCIRL